MNIDHSAIGAGHYFKFIFFVRTKPALSHFNINMSAFTLLEGFLTPAIDGCHNGTASLVFYIQTNIFSVVLIQLFGHTQSGIIFDIATINKQIKWHKPVILKSYRSYRVSSNNFRVCFTDCIYRFG